MKQKKIKIFDKEIAYYESKDMGKPVIFVHGMLSSSSIFIRQLIDSALSYQFRFIALDLIGYGNSEISDNPLEEYSLKGLSKVLIEFTKILNLKNAIYVGHNLGGNIAIESFKDLLEPRGIVLLGSVPLSNPVSKEIFLQKKMFDLFEKPEFNNGEIAHITELLVEPNTKFPDFIPEVIRKADPKTRQYIFESINNGIYSDQLNIIKGIKVPVAVYAGEYDQIINLKYLESVEIPTMWKGNIQIIKDAGHIFFYESPADFNVSIETYLHTVFR